MNMGLSVALACVWARATWVLRHAWVRPPVYPSRLKLFCCADSRVNEMGVCAVPLPVSFLFFFDLSPVLWRACEAVRSFDASSL